MKLKWLWRGCRARRGCGFQRLHVGQDVIPARIGPGATVLAEPPRVLHPRTVYEVLCDRRL